MIFGILVGLIILVFLVVVHELGHAIAARRSGVVVEEFGIGFPPRAWSRKLKNGILLSLNWLPLGGFVKLQGEHDAADQPGDYGAASFWQKTKILLAGVVINWLVAVVLLSALAVTGLPKILENQFTIPGDTTIVTGPVEVGVVEAGTPAAEAGLEVGDRLIRVAGQPLDSSDALMEITAASRGQAIEIIYERGGLEASAGVTLRQSNDDGKGYLGVGTGQRESIKATWSAPIVGFVTTLQMTGATLQGLGDLVVNFFGGLIGQLSLDAGQREQAKAEVEAASSQVAGPIGILGVIFPEAAQTGLTQLTFLTAIISLTLAVMNALPIPALDGGRWATMAIFRLLKRPLTKKREEAIQSVGMIVLLSLIVLVTIADVGKLFG